MMATPRIGRARNAHLYLEEWFEHRDLSDETVANRIGVTRQTVFRWRTGKRKPDLVALASAFDMKPERFFRPPEGQPERPSLDAMTKDIPDEQYNALVNIVKSFGKTGT